VHFAATAGRDKSDSGIEASASGGTIPCSRFRGVGSDRREEYGIFIVVGSKIAIDRERTAEFCRRHHIRRLALFGSVLTDDFRPDSDVDVLVDFEPGQVIGFRIFDIEDELSQILGGHRVDLVREKYLNRRLRNRVLAGAETQYAER
jgi:uncharacterized protein